MIHLLCTAISYQKIKMSSTIEEHVHCGSHWLPSILELFVKNKNKLLYNIHDRFEEVRQKKIPLIRVRTETTSSQMQRMKKPFQS